MSTPKGWSTQEKDQRLIPQFATVEPVRELQHGLSVLAHQFVAEIDTATAEAGSSEIAIISTASGAKAGDIIRLTSGALDGREIKVYSVVGNTITLAEELPVAVATGVTFQILRHKYPLVEPTGEVKISGSFTSSEQAVAEPGDPIPADVKVIGGSDSGTARAIAVDSAGNLQVDVLTMPAVSISGVATNAAQTDGSQKTQLVDGSGNVISSTANALDVNLKSPITVDVSLDDSNDSVAVFGTDGTVNRALKTDAAGELQIDVLSSALPVGAATASNQTSGSHKTQIVDGAGAVISSTANALDVNIKSPITVDVSLNEANDTVAVYGTDGTVNRALKTDAAGELQVDVLTCALPAGAASATNQTSGGQKTQLVDGSGNVISSTANALDVNLKSPISVDVSLSNANDDVLVYGFDGTVNRKLKTDAAGELQVDVLSTALPTGASTSAIQTNGSQKTQLVDGTGNVISSTANALDVNLKSPITVDVSLSHANDDILIYGFDGTTDRKIATDATGRLQVDIGSAALPTDAATETTLDLVKDELVALNEATNASGGAVTHSRVIVPGFVDSTSTNVYPVQGDSFFRLQVGAAITDTAGLNAVSVTGNRLEVDGSGVTQPISSTDLTSIDGKLGTLGQKNMAGSAPVVIASDQSAIPITGTITASNTANGNTGSAVPVQATQVGGSDGTNLRALKVDAAGELQIDVLSSALPTGAATETTLAAMSAKIPALTLAGGLPVEVLQQDGLLDSGNTTAVALGSNGVFTGTWRDGVNWSAFQLGIFSDQASATNGVNVQFSYDGVTVHHNHYYAYAGGSNGIGYAFPVEFRYFRVVYTNTTVAQTTFRLITVLKANAIQPSQYRLTNPLSDETQASVSRSLIFGKTTGGGGGYVDVKVNPSGSLTVDASVTSSALPTGAATETTLSTLNGKVTACNTGAVVVSSSALPSGAATETTLGAIDTKIPANLTVTATRLLVDGSGVTQPISAASLPLPTGAATETTLSALNTKMPAQGQALMAASVPVVIASNQTPIPVSGSFTPGALSVVDLLDAGILDTSVTNIPGSASSPVQVIASTAAAIKKLQCLDTTGSFIGVYTGGIGVEVLKFVIGPGSDQTIEHEIPSASRVSLKRLDATAAVSSGIVAINCMG